LAVLLGVVALVASARAQDDSKTVAEVRAAGEQLAEAFNAGKVDALAAMFLPKGELIDEQGNVYQGPAEISELLRTYFAKFPGASLALHIDSIRPVGPVVIEEGTRSMMTADGSGKAQIRYVAVRVKGNDGWKIASIREFADDPLPTPHEQLQPLAWLVGDWINEGSDAVVKISCRWSEDKNFLLVDFLVHRDGQLVMKSSQRIGWDPLAGKIRSWTFDSDGGFAEGTWTFIEDTWVIKSTAVMPDGSTGSATVALTPQGEDRYTMAGTERIVGDVQEDDFEVTVTKQPPAASKPSR
jgi:uncharacterized protein (TIGR02246 family)